MSGSLDAPDLARFAYGMLLWRRMPVLNEGFSRSSVFFDHALEPCAVRDMVCIDLRAAFIAYDGNAPLSVNQFDGHPNAAANAIAAEAILASMAESWVTAAQIKRGLAE